MLIPPSLLDRYPSSLQGSVPEFLGNAGGFSGSRFWKWNSADRQLLLRRWPAEHPSATQLEFIHRVLLTCSDQLSILPVPLATRDGKTFVLHDGYYWEITPWLPGQVDYHVRP